MPDRPSVEKVETAAVRVMGKIFTGPMHFLAFNKAKKEMPEADFDSEITEQGYLTTTGRFITRAEAGELANAAGQLKYLSESEHESAVHRLATENLAEAKRLEEELEA